MYKCRKCGNIFENTSKSRNDRRYDPEYDGCVSNCPDCGFDDYIEVEPCRVCGKYIGSDNFKRMCSDCENMVRNDMKKELFEFCRNLKDYEFDILEDILSKLELTSLIRKIRYEMEENENA